jgi:hypothetical protein
LFAQGVRGDTAAGASAVLTPMLLGWASSALLSARLFVAIGFRRTAMLGTGLIALGTALLVLVGPATPLPLVMAAMAICGVGFGTSSPAFLIGPQSAVPWSLRGAVTSSVQFFRTIGGSLGVALLGAVLNSRLATGLPTGISADEADRLVNAIVNATERATLPPEIVQSLSLAMAAGLHLVYLALAAIAAVGLVQVVLFARAQTAPRQEARAPEPTMDLAG